jgi:hypothetical protein
VLITLNPSSHVSLSRSLATSSLPPFGLTVLLSCFPIPVGLAPTDRRHGARDWTPASSNALYPTRKMRTLLLSVQSVTAVEFETHSSALEISKQCRACLETRLFSCTASLTFFASRMFIALDDLSHVHTYCIIHVPAPFSRCHTVMLCSLLGMKESA